MKLKTILTETLGLDVSKQQEILDINKKYITGMDTETIKKILSEIKQLKAIENEFEIDTLIWSKTTLDSNVNGLVTTISCKVENKDDNNIWDIYLKYGVNGWYMSNRVW